MATNHLTPAAKKALAKRASDESARRITKALQRLLRHGDSDCLECFLKPIVIGVLSDVASSVAFLTDGDHGESAMYVELFRSAVDTASNAWRRDQPEMPVQ